MGSADVVSILVIDGDKGIRNFCGQAFGECDYQVHEEENAHRGFQKAVELQPDVVLLDLKTSGVGAVDDLSGIVSSCHGSIVIVTGEQPDVPTVVEAIRRGAYDFLPKPFTTDELRSSVERGVEKKRSALEAELIREEKRRMKEEFVSMVSHELRSPVATVLQYFEVLLGGVAGEIPSEQRKILERMRDRLRELLTVIRDWLDVAQLDAGRLIKKFKDLDVIPLISETLDFMREDMKARHLSLVVDLPASLPLIRGDARTLRLVITNLVSNAVKYNREGGRITVSASAEDSAVKIEVSDTGIGISEEDLPSVFDEFFRAKTIEAEGTGLGLSITQKIVEAHSGSITATSVLGEGSTFVVSLPIASE